MKTKTIFLIVLGIAMMATPFHVSAMEERKKEDESKSHAFTTAENSQRAEEGADKAVAARASNKVGSGAIGDDDDADKLLSDEGESATALSEKIDHKLAEIQNCIAEQLEKSLAAEKAGRLIEAQKRREAVEQYQISSEAFTEAATAYVVGTKKKKNAGDAWHNVGVAAGRAARQLKKAIEVEAGANANGTVLWRGAVQQRRDAAEARLWREVAEQNQRGSEIFASVARSCTVKNSFNYGRGYWSDAGHATLYMAEQLEKAIEAEKAGELTEAQERRKAVEQYQISSEAFTNAARASAVNSIFSSQTHDWHGVGWYFQSAVQAREEAIEADRMGNTACAKLWRQVTQQHEQIGEKYKQAAEARSQGDDPSAERLHSEAAIMEKEGKTLAYRAEQRKW